MKVDSAHERIRDLAVAHANRVRQVSEYRCWGLTKLAGGLTPRLLEGLANDAAGALQDDRRAAGDHIHLDPEVLERHSRAEPARAIRFRCALANQHGVGLALDAEIALQAPERREDGPQFALLRLKRELAELCGRQGIGHRQPHGAAEIFFVREQRLDRNLGRLLQAGQQDVAGPGVELRAERRRDEDTLPRLQPVKPPEPIVHAIHEHTRGAALRRLVGDEAARGNQRHRGPGAVCHEIRRELIAEVAD